MGIVNRDNPVISATIDPPVAVNIANGGEVTGAITETNSNLGDVTDTSATSDTGSFSLISLFKRLLEKLTSYFSRTVDDTDTRFKMAIEEYKSIYGIDITFFGKKKRLFKFGRNNNIDLTAGGQTIMEFQTGATPRETLPTTNSITTIVSSSTLDTMVIKLLEGHTVDGTGLTFTVQTNITLTGQTPVTIPTALARATRARLSAPANGTIHFYEGGAAVLGVPSNPNQTHMIITPGNIQTRKASTSMSKTDVMLVTQIEASLISNQNRNAEVVLEIKPYNDTDTSWYPITKDIAVTNNLRADLTLDPPLIVPTNHDMRLRASGGQSAITPIVAGFNGYLGTIVT